MDRSCLGVKLHFEKKAFHFITITLTCHDNSINLFVLDIMFFCFLFFYFF